MLCTVGEVRQMQGDNNAAVMDVLHTEYKTCILTGHSKYPQFGHQVLQ